MFLLVLFLQGKLDAYTIINWTAGDYNIPNLEWSNVDVLNTYNNVTVTILDEGGGGVSDEFNMYDHSHLTMFGGFIDELNLYPNATATIYGGDYIGSIWVDTASTGWVKLYAVELFYDPLYNTIDYKWLDDDMTYVLQLYGSGTYSHLQFIPEPTSAVLFTLGSLFISLRNRRQ